MKTTKHVEVLVAYTFPAMWAMTKRKLLVVQNSKAADADYIAFIIIGLMDGKKHIPGIITHIAKVKKVLANQPDSNYLENEPLLKGIHDDKEWSGNVKEYYLESIEELNQPIPHRKGDPARGQVNFHTTLAEIKKAKVLSDIKTCQQLEKLAKN